MLGGAAQGATHARAGVTLPRRSRGPNRETIRGMGHGSNSDRGAASTACELVAPTTPNTILFRHVFRRDDLGQRLEEGGHGVNPVCRYVRVDHDHERGVLLGQIVGPGVVAGQFAAVS